jgi:hypothetical protein
MSQSNTEHMTRRTALKGVAALAVATVAPATAIAATSDAELFRLEARLNKAWAAWKATDDPVNKAEKRYFATTDRTPFVEEEMPPDLDAMFLGLTIAEHAKMPASHPIKAWFQAAADRRAAWNAEREAADATAREASGLDDAEAIRDAAWETVREITNAIFDTPADTLAGVMVKVRADEAYSIDEADHEGFASIVADLRGIAAAA